ncbi:flagellar hook-associated protein FlgL [Desulfitobacterium sp. AusDCA]
MRVTNNMMSQGLLRNLEGAQVRLSDLQDQLSSGQRISKPSDDPVGIENVMRLTSTLASVGQWKNNASEALSIMKTTDSSLSNLNSMLQRIRELTVQTANDSNSTDERLAAAQEVDQLTSQIEILGNTQVGDKYIFGGTQTNTPPISGGTWVGNTQDITFQVGNNLTIPVTVSGDKLFGTSAPDLLGTLKALSNDLKDSTKTGADINSHLDDLDANINNVLAIQADLGARTNRMTTISDQLDTMTLNLTANLSTIQDTDMAKTIVDFNSQQNVYKAALSVGAQIIQTSLVDFMK